MSKKLPPEERYKGTRLINFYGKAGVFKDTMGDTWEHWTIPLGGNEKDDDKVWVRQEDQAAWICHHDASTQRRTENGAVASQIDDARDPPADRRLSRVGPRLENRIRQSGTE